jgi:hypothetical protein
MVEIIQKAEKLRYKTIEIPKLTRGIARDSTELIGNTPLVRLNWITKGVKAEEEAKNGNSCHSHRVHHMLSCAKGRL